MNLTIFLTIFLQILLTFQVTDGIGRLARDTRHAHHDLD
jgi:hypothetical protein